MARVDDQGILDPSFGGTGKVVTELAGLGGFVYDLALQLDGNIVVVGLHHLTLEPEAAAYNAVLIRYLPDGSTDAMFGLNGISETNYGYPGSGGGDVRVQADGRIVVAGNTSGSGGNLPYQAVTARYVASGGADAGIPSSRPPSEHEVAR